MRLLTVWLLAVLLAIGTIAKGAEKPVTLKEAFKEHFLVGTAATRGMVTGRAGFRRSAEQNAKDIALLKEQFNHIVPENDLKWESIHPREGADGYDFSPADAFVNFGLSNKMDQALTELAALGLPIHITELDVNSAVGGQRGFGADISANASATQGGLVSNADKQLADTYAGIFRAFLKHADAVKMVTFWGANDANSWRANGKPLLFDGNNQPKGSCNNNFRVKSGVATISGDMLLPQSPG